MAGLNAHVISALSNALYDIDWASTEPAEEDLKYVIFYDEGVDFLRVTELGSGTQGTAILVQSVADNKLYVRKTESLKDQPSGVSNTYYADTSEFPEQHQQEPNEVAQY